MGKCECSVVDCTDSKSFYHHHRNSNLNFNFFRSRHSSHWKMSLIGSFYVLALILDVVSSAATIFTSQTSYIEGSKVVLACKATTSDLTRWIFKDKTLSQNCIVRDTVKITVCDQANLWFNLTIDSIQRIDDGTYECFNGVGVSVKIDVLVDMVKDVELKVVKDRILPNDTKPIPGFMDLRPNLSNDTTIIVECTTDCAYFAPIISWYGAYFDPQQQPQNINLDEKNFATRVEPCAGDLGLLRSISLLTLTAEDKKSSSEAQQNITCSARQDFTSYGGGDVIKRGQVRVVYGVTQRDEPVRQSEMTVNSELLGGLVACGVIVALAVVGLLLYYFCYARPKQRGQFRSAGKVEHGVELNGKKPDNYNKKEAEPMMDNVEVAT